MLTTKALATAATRRRPQLTATAYKRTLLMSTVASSPQPSAMGSSISRQQPLSASSTASQQQQLTRPNVRHMKFAAAATGALVAGAAAIYTTNQPSSLAFFSTTPAVNSVQANGVSSSKPNGIAAVGEQGAGPATLQQFSGPSPDELKLQTKMHGVRAASNATTNNQGIKLLSEEEIAQALSAHTLAVPIERGHVASTEVSWYQANYPRIEDTYSIAPVLSAGNGMLIGVFDGHSGNAASEFCRDELLTYLNEYKRTKQSDVVLDAKSFVAADNDFLDYALLDKRSDDGLAGACAVVVHVDGPTVSAANIGDCRAVVMRKGKGGRNGYQAIELTQDHQIDTNEAEKQRLLKSHPGEPDVIHRNRVKGRLQPTRGMGDGIYKRNEYYQIKAGKYGRELSKFGWTAPYITASPEISRHQLQSNDEYLVMSTDGLFQDMNSQQVADYVGEYVNSRGNTANPATGLSNYLIRKALLHAAMRLPRAYRETEQTALSSLMQLPEGMRRNLHDDITVVVVKLAGDKQFQPDTASTAAQLQPAPTLNRALRDPQREQRQQKTIAQDEKVHGKSQKAVNLKSSL